MSSRILNVSINYNVSLGLTDADVERLDNAERGESNETPEHVVCALVNQQCAELGGVRFGDIEGWNLEE